MKNILIIQAGRANGNTAQLTKSFAKGATEAGHSVEIIPLYKTKINGCLGCNACRYGKPCVQKDAFNDLVPKIKTADCIVFASPLYFWTFAASIKAFIERFYCIAEEDSNPPLGRYESYPVHDSALLMTSADDFFWTFEQAVSYYKFAVVNYIGFHDKPTTLCTTHTLTVYIKTQRGHFYAFPWWYFLTSSIISSSMKIADILQFSAIQIRSNTDNCAFSISRTPCS